MPPPSPPRPEPRLIAARRLGPRSRTFAVHVLQKIGALTLGPILVSRPVRALRRRLAPAPAGNAARSRPAIVAHAYYVDVIPEILACRAVLPAGTPVFLTVPHDKVAAAEAAVAGENGVTIVPSENRGRDIGPFLALLNAGRLDGFDAVLKLHTKRSPHLLDGEVRRKLLFDALCGTGAMASGVLAQFDEPETGIVGWGACYRTAPPYWMANEANVRAFAARMGLEGGAVRLGFFEGSMFWFRPAALARLKGLALAQEDFEAEAGQVDGTLHHAIERAFTIAAWANGFTVRDMKGRVLAGA